MMHTSNDKSANKREIHIKEEKTKMTDYAVNEKEAFEYTYSAKQQDEIERIRSKYVPKKESKMEQLRKLDQKAERPGIIVALALGVVGTLIFGTGMCCTMLWADKVFVLGIFLGIIGLGIALVAYPVYVKITASERAKVAEQIIALSNELSLEK